MLKALILIGSGVCFSFYIYGVIFKVVNTEKNECHMTYMFEYPFFGRIKFKENSFYPKYGLYAYSEGIHIEKVRAKVFNGAPVIFIPGNGGSFKQARSLASVALRKAIDMNWRKSLDYFTVDLNEELSGVFGGYLNDQKNFVKLCIFTVLNLYKNVENKPRQVILIGHSMGGKIAQSLLADNDIAKHINTILTLATPVDEPVVNLDFYIDSFYNDINNYLDNKRSLSIATNETNYCENCPNILSSVSTNKAMLDDKLLISIGGGSRDFLVHEGLTKSKFSDINVLTTSIPNVWVSTDHLCAVWCLQLILVINRFLFSLLSIHEGKSNYRKALNFIEDKSEKLEKAENVFLNPSLKYLSEKEDFIQITPKQSDWFEDSRRNFVETFPNGINKTRIQMIRLFNDFQHAIVSIEAVNINVDDWIFGCSVTDVSEAERFCSKPIRLSYVIEKLPSTKSDHYFTTLDLERIRHERPDWTHVLLYIRPSKQKMKLQVDIYGRGDRLVSVKTSEWFAFYKKTVHSMTISGKSYYKILLPAVTEAFQTLQLRVNSLNCFASTYRNLAKVCVPWTRGCNRYRFLTKENEFMMEIYSPLSKPLNYNTSVNPVSVELYLNSNCEYNISLGNSFGAVASRIVQQHYHRFPSYLLAFLILILHHQISSNFKCITGKFSMIPTIQLLLLTIAPLTLIQLLQLFEIPLILINKTQPSFLVSVTMSGAALAVIQISSLFSWFSIIGVTKLLRLFRIVAAQLKIRVVFKSEKFLSVVSLTLVLFSVLSCGGMTLICACLVYFLFIVKEYDSYSTLILQDSNKSSQKIQTYVKGENNCKDGKNTSIESFRILENIKAESELDDLIKQTLSTRTKKITESGKCCSLIEERLGRIYVHITLLMMLLVLTSLNIPSTVCWIKNFRFTPILTPDPSLRPTIFSLVCLSFIWQLPLPKNVGILHPFYWLCHFCTLFCITYCQDSVFYLNFMIGVLFGTIGVSQIIK